EKENHVWKFLAEPLTQEDFIVADRPMLFAIQRNRNLAVSCSNVGHITLRNASPSVGNPDVIENRIDLSGRKGIANLLLGVGKAYLRLLDSSARAGARVKPQRAGINVRKEVPADQPDQPKRSQ